MSSLAAALAVPSPGFQPDVRFASRLAAELSLGGQDRAEGAFADGYAKGFADGSAQAEAQAAADTAACERIELALGRLSDAETVRIETRLREAVLALCEQTFAPLTVDPEALAARVDKAAALLRRSVDERLLRLHPADAALLADRLPEGTRVEPDPTLERGELRFETAEGGVEDGPGQWRRALCEALGL
ncbi:MAG TPA: FliH/SctL family protein [Croceibacterium sp.]|nr:FliH/SctL family protein [Croceibacterium sp.]